MLFCATVFLASCANNSSALRDAGEEQRARRCADDQTLACIEKLGKVVSCQCSNRDELRRIIEPDRH